MTDYPDEGWRHNPIEPEKDILVRLSEEVVKNKKLETEIERLRAEWRVFLDASGNIQRTLTADLERAEAETERLRAEIQQLIAEKIAAIITIEKLQTEIDRRRAAKH